MFIAIQRKIFGRMSDYGSHYQMTSIVFIFPTMIVNGGGSEIYLVTDILPNIFLCIQQNKELYTGLEQPEGE